MSEILEHLRFVKPAWMLLFGPCLLLLILRRGRGAEAAIAFSSLSVLISLGAKVRRTAFSLGLPLMLLLLATVFWLTISGANHPSRVLATGLDK